MGVAVHKKRSGFSLIELMIVVAILGVLAAVAIPSFVTYIRRAKTVEATENVSKMFDLTASYYTRERAISAAIEAGHMSHCSVVDGTDAHVPSTDKQSSDENTYAGGFAIDNGIGFHANLVYYAYTLSNVAGAQCDHATNVDIYRLRARGDLDGDGTRSLFQLSVGSDRHNELYRARTFYIERETE